MLFLLLSTAIWDIYVHIIVTEEKLSTKLSHDITASKNVSSKSYYFQARAEEENPFALDVI